MELIMYEAFQVFKEEGVEYASLGVAPLAGLKEENAGFMEKLLEFVYEHLNQCYGFKDLYRAKEKYSPTVWEHPIMLTCQRSLLLICFMQW